MKSEVGAYLSLLFRPFFRWWWAAVTGLASILSVLVTPQAGFVLKPWLMFSMTFLVCGLIFPTLTTTIQGWALFRQRHPDLRVIAWEKTREHGGEYVAVLSCDVDVPSGTLLELRSTRGETETLFALVEIRNRMSKGNYLCLPVWTSPGNQKDLFSGKLAVSQLVVVPLVQRDTLRRLDPLT